MSKKSPKGGIGCGTIILGAFLFFIAIAIYSYAWIPAIIASIFFLLKKERVNRKRNLIISLAIAVTSLFLFVGTKSTPELTGIDVDWGTTEYSISDFTEIKVTPIPSNAKIDSLEISENPIAELNYDDGEAFISFKAEGTASVFLKANGNIQSDTEEITVTAEESDETEALNSFSNDTEEPLGHDVKVHFIDVGQGLSVLIQSDDKSLIYDGGGKGASRKVVSYLKEQNIDTIDYLISSHYDEDHVSGLIGCLNAFSVNNVIGADYVHDSKLYHSFMDAVSAQDLEVQHPAVGETFDLGTSQFTILAPKNIKPDESNDNSIAIKITCGDNNFILTGDAEHGSEKDMIQSGIDLSCDVLCLGHHGSANSTSWDFLEKTVPEFAVISCGADNQYSHPDKDTLDKLSSMDISLFRTDKQGSVIAESDGTSITWNVEPCNDYTPGNPKDSGTEKQEDTNEQKQEDNSSSTKATEIQEPMVWIPESGSKYHSKASCSGMKNPTEVTESKAISMGYEPCKRCH